MLREDNSNGAGRYARAVLRCAGMYCVVSWYDARCVMLCCVVMCYVVLCYVVLCCAVLRSAVLCSAVLCCAVLCCAVLCAVLCCAVLCCATQSYGATGAAVPTRAKSTSSRRRWGPRGFGRGRVAQWPIPTAALRSAGGKTREWEDPTRAVEICTCAGGRVPPRAIDTVAQK